MLFILTILTVFIFVQKEKNRKEHDRGTRATTRIRALVSCKDSRVTYCFVKCRSPI